MFNGRGHIEQLIVFLNILHKNLKCASKIKHNRMLTFISINVIKKDINFMLSIHYKKNKGVYTNFSSNLPDIYEKGAFICLLSRVYYIRSDWSIINDDLSNNIKFLHLIFTHVLT